MQPDNTNQTIIPNDPVHRHSAMRDLIGIGVFIVSVIVGAFLLNSFVFQTYSVLGPSMENTLHTGDRLLVNKFAVTFSHLTAKKYIPNRGQVIVFENPLYHVQQNEEFLVKRVIGLPGERVTLKDGVYTVYNQANPGGFDPDKLYTGPKSPTKGEVDLNVPEGEVFVSGDNRIGEYSFDSRNGLGTVPVDLIQGPVSTRIFPISQFRTF